MLIQDGFFRRITKGGWSSSQVRSIIFTRTRLMESMDIARTLVTTFGSTAVLPRRTKRPAGAKMLVDRINVEVH